MSSEFNLPWPMVSLGEILTQYKEYIHDLEPRMYPKLSVKLYGKGVVLDEPVNGLNVKMRRHQLAKSDQVILSEIWGKKGAIGFVPPEGAGALCTSHFFLFNVNEDKILPRYLEAIFRGNYLEPQLGDKARGTTGYAAVRPKHLLAAQIPLPPLEEQQRVVARIEALATKVEAARQLREEATAETEALILSALSQQFDYQVGQALPTGWRWRSFQEVLIDPKGGMKTGPFGTLLQKSEVQKKGVPVLGIANVDANRFIPGFKDYVSYQKAEELASYRLREGDIVVARSGTVGRSCVVPEHIDFRFADIYPYK